MKRMITIILVLATLVTLPACSHSVTQNILDDYSKALADGIPKDLSLTIYYIPFSVLTRAPLGAEDLIKLTDVEKIVIGFDELLFQQDLLKKLNSSVIRPTEEECKVNARLYYFFELGNGDRLAEVTISQIGSAIVVNGIGVEYDSVFYDVVSSYLPTNEEWYESHWGQKTEDGSVS